MLNFHTITDRNIYKQEQFNFIKKEEGCRLLPYVDAVGKPSTGIGFNLTTIGVRTRTFEAFGINPANENLSVEGKAKELAYQTELTNILTRTYPKGLSGDALDQANASLRAELNEVMARRKQDELVNIQGKKETFSFSNNTEIKQVFDVVVPVYENKVDAWAAKYGITTIPDSKERIVLESLAYNTKDGSGSLLGKNLAKAIKDGDRQEAWYQIRYESNKNGIHANRRYKESDMFGLFNSDTSTLDESKQIITMYETHKEKILFYENKFKKNRPPISEVIAMAENIVKNGDPSWIATFVKDNASWLDPYFVANKLLDVWKGVIASASAAMFKDPLILDLDNDGIETTNVKDGAYFDHDGNGFTEQTGWTSSDDGLLVMDRNADGIINDGKELFGDQTILQNGQRATDGFQALAELDTNADGVININDAAFSNLRIWQDIDGDGYSASDELFTLQEMGISSINVAHTDTNITDSQGNTQIQAGTFTKTDNSTASMGGFNLQRDETYSIATEWLDVPDNIAALPDLQGYGNTYDLHQAMVRDTTGTLKSLIEQFIASEDPAVRDSLMEQILFKWTGSDTIDPTSRGGLFDARKLAVIEKLMGQAFAGANGPDPNFLASPLLAQASFIERMK